MIVIINNQQATSRHHATPMLLKMQAGFVGLAGYRCVDFCDIDRKWLNEPSQSKNLTAF